MLEVGDTDGSLVGVYVRLGCRVGNKVGAALTVGSSDGKLLGAKDGKIIGLNDGYSEGIDVGVELFYCVVSFRILKSQILLNLVFFISPARNATSDRAIQIHII